MKPDESKFKFSNNPERSAATLIVAWTPDAGKVGAGVVEYLNRKLQSSKFAQIEPINFFPLDGVTVQNDVAQFPETEFYYCQNKGLVLVKSDIPGAEWYKFLSSILDIAEEICRIKEMFVIGGMAAVVAHTTPRVLLTVANSSQEKGRIANYDVVSNMEYETPEGQRPTINSFLLWVAQRRGIPAVNLWVQVPFYLVAMEDPQAWRKVLDFLDSHLKLQIDFAELNEKVVKQNQRIAQARSVYPDLDDCLSRLESNLGLNVNESEKLIRKMEELLRETG